jgi:D-proline reductase (dithiol) PrdB
MGEIAEFPVGMQLFLRAYRWRRIDPVPWATLRRPLREARLALVSSAGFVAPGQQPFDASVRGGDASFREIPSDADPAALVDSHRSQAFDHAGMRRDPNLAFPIERARELVARGRVGSLAQRHLSFMGSITATARLVRDSAPRAARALVRQEVDVALLVPV